jgi:hypothetical protein
MMWERLRDGAGLLTAVFLPLWWLDFVAYIAVSQFVGGTYFYGHAAGGEYFLAHGASHDTHPLTQVSEQVYYYSVYHHWSIIALAWIFGPAFLVWGVAGAVCRRWLRPLRVLVTPQGIALNGKPASIEEVVAALREVMRIQPDRRPEIRIQNDYEASDAPRHAVAFQLELIDHGLLVVQEPPRGRVGSPA